MEFLLTPQGLKLLEQGGLLAALVVAIAWAVSERVARARDRSDFVNLSYAVIAVVEQQAVGATRQAEALNAVKDRLRDMADAVSRWRPR
jgi:hypothetical protein